MLILGCVTLRQHLLSHLSGPPCSFLLSVSEFLKLFHVARNRDPLRSSSLMGIHFKAMWEVKGNGEVWVTQQGGQTKQRNSNHPCPEHSCSGLWSATLVIQLRRPQSPVCVPRFFSVPLLPIFHLADSCIPFLLSIIHSFPFLLAPSASDHDYCMFSTHCCSKFIRCHPHTPVFPLKLWRGGELPGSVRHYRIQRFCTRISQRLGHDGAGGAGAYHWVIRCGPCHGIMWHRSGDKEWVRRTSEMESGAWLPGALGPIRYDC